MTELPPGQAPDYLAARIEQYAELAPGDPRRLAPEVADRLRAHLPVVRRWAEQVAALGLPLTLNHNDLHENNVFDVAGRLRFFDFGDSLLTEPLGRPADPAQHPRREARRRRRRPAPVAGGRRRARGLERPGAARRAAGALPAALQLGRLGRVESWVRCQPSLSDDELAEWGPIAATWLGTLDADPPVGAPSSSRRAGGRRRS